MNGTRSAVALGGNLGDPLALFRTALRGLGRIGVVTAVSRVYETAPVGGPPGQPNYYNQVALITVPGHVQASDVLRELQTIELAAGRTREIYHGPRTLDLDLIFFDNDVRDDEWLTLPHPRMHERAFVLVPLVEALNIAGWDWHHPRMSTSATALLQQLPPEETAPLPLTTAVF